MFRNRAFQVRVVRTDEPNTAPAAPVFPSFSKEDIKDAAKELMESAAGCTMAVMVTAAVLKTASEIIIHHATK